MEKYFSRSGYPENCGSSNFGYTRWATIMISAEQTYMMFNITLNMAKGIGSILRWSKSLRT